ncbi:MAG: hypothetical protein K8U57_12595 [Planctomycetes bacterium]|nr:hypothetical protein [Planctomycetota bacterium]
MPTPIPATPGHSSRLDIENWFPLDAWESVNLLYKLFAFMERNGTNDHQSFLNHFFPGNETLGLEMAVRNKTFAHSIEAIKIEALRNKIPLSNGVLAEICAGSLKWGEPLPLAVRNQLTPLLDELLAHRTRVLATEEIETPEDGTGHEESVKPESKDKPDKRDMERAAIAAVLAGEMNVTKIARDLAVPRTTLNEWKLFKKTLTAARRAAETNKQSRRGNFSGSNDYAQEED